MTSRPRSGLAGAARAGSLLSLLAAACGRPAPSPVPEPARTGETRTEHGRSEFVEGPRKHTPHPTTAGITAEDLRTRLYIFADDSMEGREAGVIGGVRGTAYIASEAKRLGLLPAGDQGSYFQAVPMVTLSVDSATSITAPGGTLRLWEDVAPLPPIGAILPFGRGLPAAEVTTIYGGRFGDSVATITDDQAVGKLVVLAAPLGPDGAPTWSFLGRGDLTRFPLAAGVAIATLDISPPGLLDFFRQAPAALSAPTQSAQLPLGMLLTRAAAARLLGGPLDSLRPGATGQSVRGGLRFAEHPTPAPVRNVVAILPGRDPAVSGEYVALGAHSDHIGIMPAPLEHDSLRAYNRVLRPGGAEGEPAPPTPAQLDTARRGLDSLRRLRPPRPDSIANGADDDGSGSVALLEIAEALAASRERPRRSVLFVWHTAEEKGLFGSEWFTDHPSVPRDSIVAQVNMDMVGRGWPSDHPDGGPQYLMALGSRRLSTELGDLVEKANRDGRHGFRFDYSYDADGHPMQLYCRSDHYEYARFGIPVVFFSTGLHQDYHQVTDEPQYMNYEQLARVGSFVRDVVVEVADLDHRLVVDKPKPAPGQPCRQ